MSSCKVTHLCYKVHGKPCWYLFSTHSINTCSNKKCALSSADLKPQETKVWNDVNVLFFRPGPHWSIVYVVSYNPARHNSFSLQNLATLPDLLMTANRRFFLASKYKDRSVFLTGCSQMFQQKKKKKATYNAFCGDVLTLFFSTSCVTQSEMRQIKLQCKHSVIALRGETYYPHSKKK